MEIKGGGDSKLRAVMPQPVAGTRDLSASCMRVCARPSASDSERVLPISRRLPHVVRAWVAVREKARCSMCWMLDSQRQVIEADSALTSAEALYAGAIVALYRALGAY